MSLDYKVKPFSALDVTYIDQFVISRADFLELFEQLDFLDESEAYTSSTPESEVQDLEMPKDSSKSI